jgi:hypothetical protein
MRVARKRWSLVVALVASMALGAIGACSQNFSSGGGTGGDGGEQDASVSDSAGDGVIVVTGQDAGDAAHVAADAAPPCVNLQCQVHACDGGGSTTISGTVLDPAGRNPLNDVVVYVPNSPGGALDPLPAGVTGASCSCSALYSGQPMAVAHTDARGRFSIQGAPDGAGIPLVVQIGKWRKEITIPTVQPCQDNPQGALRLPATHAEGSMPNIAVSTGQADSLECMLLRAGIDPAEFTGDPNGAGRVHVFQGYGGNNTVPAGPASATALWDSDADLERYDVVVLSCEGHLAAPENPQAFADYVSAGGRLFAEHFHYGIFAGQPQFAGVADWDAGPGVYSTPIGAVVETTLPNGHVFPQGEALQAWLGNVGAFTDAGELLIAQAKYTVDVGAGDLGTPWIVADPTVNPPSAQYLSWDMPFDAGVTDAGEPAYCGRAVYTDLHVVGSGTIDYQNGTVVPTDCATGPLSPDEDALEFILFNLSSCVRPVGSTGP